MALINNIYVLAENEDVDRAVELTTHPTESGFPVSDSIIKKPVSVSISGKIANTGNLTTKQIVEKLEELKNKGSVVKYIGQCGVISNLQIESFKPSYNHKNFGGADFTMSLREFKTAKSAYVATNTEVKVETKPTAVVQKQKVKFLGGAVFSSSTATKPRAKRTGGSICTVTLIANSARHKYHLISTDCSYGSSKYVYGWVDASDVEGISSSTKGETNGGTQQVQESPKNFIYHTVKKGETIWGLVNKTYKGKGYSVNAIIKNNPKAFSTPNKATTLKIGARLKLMK